MSDLQISLLLLGALVVVGVYLFNRLQEKRYRARAEQVFRPDHPDVLMGKTSVAANPETVEESPAPTPRGRRAVAEPIEPSLHLEPVKPTRFLDPKLHYIVTLAGTEALGVGNLKSVVERHKFDAKPVRWQGKNPTDEAWEDIDFTGSGTYREFQVGLQLADRRSAVDGATIARFVDSISATATQLGLTPRLPDQAVAADLATQLDAFCAQYDVTVGVSVIAREGAIAASKIRALAEAEGMTLKDNGIFVARDETGEETFSMSNQENRPFLADHVRNITTRGVVFTLDVPRTKDSVRVFSRMCIVAQHFAASLNAVVVDDRRHELREPQLAKIKEQLQEIVASMAQAGIAAGSPLAQQLFIE